MNLGLSITVISWTTIWVRNPMPSSCLLKVRIELDVSWRKLSRPLPRSLEECPELPPSYATALLEDEKVAELDKRLDQQKEVIDAQNARLVEQEAKLVEMSRRLVENEQITAVADST